MNNVSVLIDEYPPPGQPGLLGLYHGIPLSRRGSGYTNVLPDTIRLYRASIVAYAGPDEQRVRGQVARTVAHEVAHHFGISDDRLREIDAYGRRVDGPRARRGARLPRARRRPDR